jgi:Flp pilus assembly protein CpaB
MNGSLKTYAQLGLALVLALSAGFLVFQWTKGGNSRTQAVRTAPVLVAARDLPAGAKLSADMLRIQNFPEAMLHAQR